ncbi:hypothetical protein CONCODRAFT_170479 [Conidiobolus coronatus NRRL 28638]|uniref:RNI-like protein n=1 Tax=Conidiobolus coronatus (strain ATCC 28846 / CBS 209.66 / NRRL 28638) TaxID=796925 RepID=A0A137P6Q5_CONC2|nr:hypothetical protein CONCODRAFT_170479 [Conidiobolus coronatus NRRL 28638]|eukprot:KXN70649.1 hypothetical protein CONCODRAFT_170479 [Conidiobolus coronatus NRRL 28638]
MGSIKWDIIFINNPEFNTYLNNNDFIELSSLSKLVRLKLMPFLFNNIFIGKNFAQSIVEECNNSNNKLAHNIKCLSELRVAEYFNLFSRCTQKFLQYVKRIDIGSFIVSYQLLEVLYLLPELTSLKISDIKVSLTTFKCVLDRLPKLESLEVEYIIFIQFKHESVQNDPIRLPKNLSYINWQRNMVALCDLNEDPETLDYNYKGHLSNPGESLFQVDYFPELKKFVSLYTSSSFNNQFLLINPHLTWLNINLQDTAESASILNHVQNIEKLELSANYVYENFANLDLSLPNLKQLYQYNINERTWQILEKLTQSSPNLTDILLTLSIDIDPPIIELINNIPNLQSLIIISERHFNFNFIELKAKSQLKYLEIHFYCNINKVLEDLVHCTNLHQVSYSMDFQRNALNPIITQEDTPKPWRLVLIGKSVNYYK